MEKNTIIWLTNHDLGQLRHLIADLTQRARGMQAGVDALEEILDLGRVVPSQDIPQDIVTMNSKVIFLCKLILLRKCFEFDQCYC